MARLRKVRVGAWSVVLPLLTLLASPLPLGAADLVEEAGRLIQIHEHRLYLKCSGKEGPTVVLEAGLGANHLDWRAVEDALAPQARVCSYDRAGAGLSESGPEPRSLSAIALDLRQLLAAGAVEPGFILVGHSFGGLVALYYASRFPEDVGGLLLVDSMHPDQFRRFAAAGVDLPTDPGPLLAGRTPYLLTQGVATEQRDYALRLATSDKALAALADEIRQLPAGMAELRARGLPQIPAAVLVHGRRDWDRLYADGRMEDTWLALQGELAAELAAGTLVVAWGSGHQVPLEDPGLIVKLVLSLVRKLRP